MPAPAPKSRLGRGPPEEEPLLPAPPLRPVLPAPPLRPLLPVPPAPDGRGALVVADHVPPPRLEPVDGRPAPACRLPLARLSRGAPPPDVDSRFLSPPARLPRGSPARPLSEAMSASIITTPRVRTRTRKRPVPPPWHGPSNNYPGDVLLSQGATPQVPSALVVLTSVFGMGTGVAPPLWSPGTLLYLWGSPRGLPLLERSIASTSGDCSPSPRPISTGRLNALLRLHLRPINLVIYQGPYQIKSVGNLILERASRLYAFSAYPFRRSPTSRALGRTTGTRELRPSRSSRTRDSLPQVSNGCTR